MSRPQRHRVAEPSAPLTLPETAVFGGVRYRLDATPIDGSCDPLRGRDPAITFPAGLSHNVYGLELLLHEGLHACHFSSQERTVERTAKDLARFLWRCGWRWTAAPRRRRTP